MNIKVKYYDLVNDPKKFSPIDVKKISIEDKSSIFSVLSLNAISHIFNKNYVQAKEILQKIERESLDNLSKSYFLEAKLVLARQEEVSMDIQLELANQALDLNQEAGFALFFKGIILLHLNNFKEGVDFGEKALNYYPDAIWIYKYFIPFLISKKRYRTAQLFTTKLKHKVRRVFYYSTIKIIADLRYFYFLFALLTGVARSSLNILIQLSPLYPVIGLIIFSYALGEKIIVKIYWRVFVTFLLIFVFIQWIISQQLNVN